MLARYSWGKMLTFGGHHGVTLMQIRHMAVAGFSSFINFQVSMAESINSPACLLCHYKKQCRFLVLVFFKIRVSDVKVICFVLV